MAEPVFRDTTATKKIFSLTKPIRAVSGGTGASKTISILIWCIDYAQSTENERIDIVSESHPHLEGGAIADFKRIMQDRGYWKDKLWNDSKHQYTFETSSRIKFTSYDKFGKAHGPRREVLFINECNNVPYGIADQIITRTSKITWLDWNPTYEFWFYKKMWNDEKQRDRIDFIKLNYKDNEALDEESIRKIEVHKGDKYWWTVYGEGELGELPGKIYSGWRMLSKEELPRMMRLECYGLDFGYTNDPTAIVAIYYGDGGYIVDEIAYGYGLSNKEIAGILNNRDKKIVVCDSAEPKSIDELISYGIQAQPSAKGSDSVNSGIQLVQQQTMVIALPSKNLIDDYQGYMWKEDKKTGERINEPEHMHSHSMDAIRYAITWLRPYVKPQVLQASEPIKLFYPELGI